MKRSYLAGYPTLRWMALGLMAGALGCSHASDSPRATTDAPATAESAAIGAKEDSAAARRDNAATEVGLETSSQEDDAHAPPTHKTAARAAAPHGAHAAHQGEATTVAASLHQAARMTGSLAAGFAQPPRDTEADRSRPEKGASRKAASRSAHATAHFEQDAVLQVLVPQDRLMSVIRSVAALLDDTTPEEQFEQLARAGGELAMDDATSYRWEVAYHGKRGPLEIEIARADKDGLDVYFFGPEPLVREIDSLCTDMMKR